MNRATHRGIGGDRDAPDEIHGIARVYGAVAAGGDGEDRLAGTGGGGRGGRRTRDGQRHCFGPAGIRREDPRRPASLDLRRVRRELHRRRGARVRHARCRLLEGLGGRGLPGPGRRVLLRGPGPGTRGDRPRGRRPRLLANWLGSRGRGGRGGGLRPDRGPGDRGGRPCPGEDRAPGTPHRGPAVRQGPVVAAGGIGTGRAMAAALAAGASAVRVGTRFVAAEEAGAHPAYLGKLSAAEAKDTILTEAFSANWPNAPHRVLRSCVEAVERFQGEFVGETVQPWAPGVRVPVQTRASFVADKTTTGEFDAMPLWAGESVDGVKRIQKAGEIVRELAGEAETLLRSWGK